MKEYIQTYKDLKLDFDAISTGFLGSEQQVDIVLDFIRHFKTDRNFVIVDPVMGDYGKLYRTYTKEMCDKMKELVHYADIITPNLTELCTLLDAPYPENGASIEELKEMCAKLAERGPKHIVVTGIHFNQTQIANFIYNKGEDFQIVMVDRIGGDRSGTGNMRRTGAKEITPGSAAPCLWCWHSARFCRFIVNVSKKACVFIAVWYNMPIHEAVETHSSCKI